MAFLPISSSARHFFTGSSIIFAVLLISLLLILEADASSKNYAYSPVNGQMSSDFGWRKDPYSKKSRFHAGIDIAAKQGTPIHVPQNGWVVYSGPYKGYGNVVVVQHDANVYTLYGHTYQYFVKKGQPVYAGQVIALVGSTGRSTGPHLHFEVRQNQGYVNPKDYLSYLAQTESPKANTRTIAQQKQATYGMGGPEVPVSYTPPAYTAYSTKTSSNTKIRGNATQAQHYRAKPGHSMQVISGSQVNVVRF